jgi:hypothetical protein
MALRGMRVIGAVGVVVVSLVMADCGTPGSGSTSRTTALTGSSTTSSSSASSPSTTASTAPSSAATIAPLPVVTCSTTFAVSTTTTSLPSFVSVRVPSTEAGNLAVYSDPAGIMMLVGPKAGWTCHGMYGADGSGGLLVAPVGESVPVDPDAGWHLGASSPDQAIVGYETGGSPVIGAQLGCPLFSSAAATTREDLGSGCASVRPPQEAVEEIGSSEIAFEDPAGVSGEGMPSGGQLSANGVLLYQPKPNESTAYLATCTLPAPHHDVCTAVLNHFVALYG